MSESYFDDDIPEDYDNGNDYVPEAEPPPSGFVYVVPPHEGEEQWRGQFPAFTLFVQSSPSGVEVGLTVRTDDEEVMRKALSFYRGEFERFGVAHTSSSASAPRGPRTTGEKRFCPKHPDQRIYWNVAKDGTGDGWWSHRHEDGWCNPFPRSGKKKA